MLVMFGVCDAKSGPWSAGAPATRIGYRHCKGQRLLGCGGENDKKKALVPYPCLQPCWPASHSPTSHVGHYRAVKMSHQLISLVPSFFAHFEIFFPHFSTFCAASLRARCLSLSQNPGPQSAPYPNILGSAARHRCWRWQQTSLTPTRPGSPGR